MLIQAAFLCAADAVRELGNMSLFKVQAGMIRRHGDRATGRDRQECRSMVEIAVPVLRG